MAKAVVLLGIDGLALAAARACAETAEEALHLDLPMLDAVLRQMCAGKDARPDGANRYELFHEGRPTGAIEIFEIPPSEKTRYDPLSDSDRSKAPRDDRAVRLPLFSQHNSRTLLMHADTVAGAHLADQLRCAGFNTELVVRWRDAHACLAANSYQSCVVRVTVDQSGNLDQVEGLRRAAPRMWIVVLSDLQDEDAVLLARRRGADAVLSMPFSMHDLTSRLAAFSLRARPIY